MLRHILEKMLTKFWPIRVGMQIMKVFFVVDVSEYQFVEELFTFYCGHSSMQPACRLLLVARIPKLSICGD
jgi:hypothetical protein